MDDLRLARINEDRTLYLIGTDRKSASQFVLLNSTTFSVEEINSDEQI